MTAAPILALDIGSTAVKAARYDADGVRVGAVAQSRHRWGTEVALDPGRVLASVLTAVNTLDCSAVTHVAMSTVWQTLVRLDAQGRAMGKITTWETPHPPEALRTAQERLGEAWDRETTGAYLHNSYPLIIAVGQQAVDAGERLLDLGGWIIESLTGTRVGWSEPIAAGSGLWDQRERTWAHAVRRTSLWAGLNTDPLFTSSIRAARLHPALPAGLRSALWMPPLPDGLCHNLAVDGIDDVVTVTAGTSGSVRSVQPMSEQPPRVGLWGYRCGAHSRAIGGAISSVGNLLEWVQRFTGTSNNWSQFDTSQPRLPSVRAVPDVFGRRGPDYPLDATGSLHGLRPNHTGHDVAAAVMVDLWSSFAALLNRLSAGYPVAVVRAGGGVLERHGGAAQLLADALGTDVQLPATTQPSLAGAARYAQIAISAPHETPTVDDIVQEIRGTAPRSAIASRTIHHRPAWTRALTDRWAAIPQ